MTEAIARVERTEALAVPMTVGELEAQVHLVQEVMARVMKKGDHYGTIPGTKKPTLFKAGAEKLGMVFHLDPTYRTEQVNLDHGHREYEVRCILTHRNTGRTWEGVGGCSTMEKKYRYRGQGSDRVENPDGSHGYFRGILSHGSKPVSPQFGYAIRHKRCDAKYLLLECDDTIMPVA